MASRVSFIASEDVVYHADDQFRYDSKHYDKPREQRTRTRPRMNTGRQRATATNATHFGTDAPPGSGRWGDAHHFGHGYFSPAYGEWPQPSREAPRKAPDPFQKYKRASSYDTWEGDDVDSLQDYGPEEDLMDDYFASPAFEGDRHFDVPPRPDPSYAFKSGRRGSRTPHAPPPPPPSPPPPPRRPPPSRFASAGYNEDYFYRPNGTSQRPAAPPPPPPPPPPTPSAYGAGIPPLPTTHPFQPHWSRGYPPSASRDYRPADLPHPFAPSFHSMRAPDPIPRPMSASPYPGTAADAYARYPELAARARAASRRAASPPPLPPSAYGYGGPLARQAWTGGWEYRDLGHRFEMAGRGGY